MKHHYSLRACLLYGLGLGFPNMKNKKETVGHPCPGCRRYEMHKMCPAYGTEYYMSGIPYTERVEQFIKNNNLNENQQKELMEISLEFHREWTQR